MVTILYLGCDTSTFNMNDPGHLGQQLTSHTSKKQIDNLSSTIIAEKIKTGKRGRPKGKGGLVGGKRAAPQQKGSLENQEQAINRLECFEPATLLATSIEEHSTTKTEEEISIKAEVVE